MRIIAGRYGSRRIETRKSRETRPTLDKVREAVFSMLGGMFSGGIFIDLYAGSGANGFEALSRGMDEAWFADISHEACTYIRKNADNLQCAQQCHILNVNALKALSMFKKTQFKADIIYMDPPYARQQNRDVLLYIDQNDLLNHDGYIVIESDHKDIFHEEYRHFSLYREKEYGITRITIYKAKETI